MLEFIQPDCIAMFFVSIRRQGIAKALLTLVVSKACILNPGLTKLIVHSSPYATSIYQKMGFNKTANSMIENGIKYVPMELLLDKIVGES